MRLGGMEVVTGSKEVIENEGLWGLGRHSSHKQRVQAWSHPEGDEKLLKYFQLVSNKIVFAF